LSDALDTVVGQLEVNPPQGLEPASIFGAFTARLKSCGAFHATASNWPTNLNAVAQFPMQDRQSRFSRYRRRIGTGCAPRRGFSQPKAARSSSPTSIAARVKSSRRNWAAPPVFALTDVDQRECRAGRGRSRAGSIRPSARIGELRRHRAFLKKSWAAKDPHRLESFAKTININLVGTFNMIRLRRAANRQRGTRRRRRAAASSSTPRQLPRFDGQMGQAAYAASKGGVAALNPAHRA